MAFEGLSEKLQGVFKKLKGKGVITESDVNDAMREVKLALLEADVNFKIVKDFVASVKEKCLGADVLQSLTPAQQIIKIVDEELTAVMGGTNSKLTYSPKGFTVIMLVGLQGTGKTTTAGKLASYLMKNGKKPMLAACDVYRPAAIDQLEIVAEKVGVPVYSDREEKHPEIIAQKAAKEAEYKGFDVLIVDTSGRLHIDEELMQELVVIRDTVKPHEILLVVDALTGQDAVNVASSFNDKIGIDGVIVTKLDGDTRGGAALSIKAVTGRPILYVGMGEKLSDLEQFYPDRMASRILGMGDVLSLIEKAGAELDEEKAKKMADKMKKAQFDFEDYLDSMEQMRKMGGLSSIMGMLPGMGNLGGKMPDLDSEENEKKMAQMEAIIYSMTLEERRNPDLLNPSRKHRIAKGAGVDIADVNRMVKQFNESRKMMKKLPGMMGGKGGKRGKFKLPF